MFSGIYTALITPFKNGQFDESAFKNILDKQITAGVSGVVPCGTTGESPTLSHDEHNRVIELCVAHVAGKIQVIAGTGSNSTEEAIATTKHAEQVGADAALIVAPYYNKPTELGLFEHFKAIHDSSNIPIILYNIPGRSVINMSVALQAELAKLPRIVGVKDATGDLALPTKIAKTIGADFVQLSGEDATLLPFYVAGGHGCISVTANIVPELCVKLHQLWQAGQVKEAQHLQEQLVELNEYLFAETNPIPVKYAAAQIGLCFPEIRLPLTELGAQHRATLDQALKNLNLC